MNTLIKSLTTSVAAIVLLAVSQPAQADDMTPHLKLELGGGAEYSPRYEGADDYRVTPYPIVRLRAFRLGSIDVDTSDRSGFSLSPSFRVLGKRDSSDSSQLGFLPDAKTSVELGLTAAYEADYWRVFASTRFGVSGHHGLVGELGADLILRPSEQWSVNIGPRMAWGDNKFMDHYFRVPVGYAPLSPYNPDGGLKSAGVELSTRYDFASQWALEGTVGWNRLISDAGKSPVAKVGDRDQFLLKVGILRSFSFGY